MASPVRHGHGDGFIMALPFRNHSLSQPELPAPPRPSADPGVVTSPTSPSEDRGTLPEGDDIDIFLLTPVVALKMLCASVEALVLLTGDIPSTPPLDHTLTSSARTELEGKLVIEPQPGQSHQEVIEGNEDADGVPARAKTPIGSPEAGPTEPFPIIGSNMESLDVQHSAITRKFYSKRPPPIPLEEYLMRLHRYCPMSTAVYLATSLYLYRLAVVEKVILITGRNAHRLLLGGLRIAMKALEDRSYPHKRFAKVGGVSESELGRLEVSFCFLTNFDLKVDEKMLLEQAISLRDATVLARLPAGFQPRLPPSRGQAKKLMD